MGAADYQPKTIHERLDAVKVRHGITSDYKLAMFLGISEAALANYRHGRSLPDPGAVVKIAGALDEEPAIMLLEIEVQRAKTPVSKAAWKGALEKISKGGHGAAVLAGVALAAAAALPGKVEAKAFAIADDASHRLYIMSNRLRRWLATLRDAMTLTAAPMPA